MEQYHNRDNSIVTMSTVTRTSSIFSQSKEVDEDDDVFSLYAYDEEKDDTKEQKSIIQDNKQHKRSISSNSDYFSKNKLKAIMITVFGDQDQFEISNNKLQDFFYAGPINKQSTIWRKAYYNDYHGFDQLEKIYTNTTDQESLQQSSIIIDDTQSIVPSTIENESIQESHVTIDELEPLSRDPKQQYHIRLSTMDGTFATILKKNETTTVQDVLEILDNKYQLKNIKLTLFDNKNQVEISDLSKNDLILKKQNDLLIQSGVKVENLIRECLNNNNRCKFIIKSDDTISNTGNTLKNSRRSISCASLVRDSKIHYHIRLSTKDESFKTILKKDETTTLGQVLQTLKKRFQLQNIKIVLEDTLNQTEITGLQNDDPIIRMQNDLLLSSGVKIEDLSKECLNKNNRFKFYIKQDTKNHNIEDLILQRDPKIIYPFRLSTPNGSFSTIFQKDETTTLGDILSCLAHAFYIMGVNELIFEDTQTNTIIKKFNNGDDEIIKYQNDFLLKNGVKFEDLNKVCGDENSRFRFIINGV
ncbi:hypothetical protein BN7_2592 [Wickerhamomyces ciferrii]|uniref:Uncharacterized protein n=1 Tax=Wickerhamomyces ciferrii (strain ATCC 14091 / BCRC 22168 / CBS 111 / JCM 3599 / NBRC 0793 / NRRL Y-1031 F-60-10) TaxID=1206466 RepID=K0KD65_WICCF|nr:uncharacterized protein BN7_2592 [Wickerhamomyces ciferrii]CCH43045.1 hypothetical protein BN7_2592 [Wickerhamomyces ciferrii]